MLAKSHRSIRVYTQILQYSWHILRSKCILELFKHCDNFVCAATLFGGSGRPHSHNSCSLKLWVMMYWNLCPFVANFFARPVAIVSLPFDWPRLRIAGGISVAPNASVTSNKPLLYLCSLFTLADSYALTSTSFRFSLYTHTLTGSSSSNCNLLPAVQGLRHLPALLHISGCLPRLLPWPGHVRFQEQLPLHV